MEWLGYDSPYVARLILASGVVFDLLGSVLVGGSLVLLGGLAVAIIRSRRVVAIRKVFRPMWRGALLVLLPLLALFAWWIALYPRYMISPPSQRDWLGIGFTLLAVGWVGYGLTRRR
jgi:drug/metabolite transporter (DMT)-like permease